MDDALILSVFSLNFLVVVLVVVLLYVSRGSLIRRRGIPMVLCKTHRIDRGKGGCDEAYFQDFGEEQNTRIVVFRMVGTFETTCTIRHFQRLADEPKKVSFIVRPSTTETVHALTT